VEILNLFLVCLAAFLAGCLNSLAGGGSFITLPALLFVGIPPVLANTTSAAVLLPGYLGSVLGFKNTFSTIDYKKILPLLLISIICSVAGAISLIKTSNEFFLKFIPFLILIATLMFIVNPSLNQTQSSTSSSFLRNFGLALVSTYGGYFNGGLGIALLSVLSLGKEFSLKQMSAIKSFLSFLITTVSVIIFFFNDFIVWSYVFYMVIFSIMGGFLGAKLTELLPSQWVRRFIILVGSVLSFSLIYTSYFK
jgi:Predicted permeases